MGEAVWSGIVVVLVEVVVATSIFVCLWSVVRSAINRDKGRAVVNGIPAARISRCVVIATVTLLAVTFLLGSSVPMLINGRNFDSATWLRISDMFVVSSCAMLVLAIIAVVLGYVCGRLSWQSGDGRRRGQKV